MTKSDSSFISITAKVVNSMKLTLLFADNGSKETTITDGDTVRFVYLDGKTLTECTGRMMDIETYGTRSMNGSNDTILKVDCSKNYVSDVRLIKISDIRDVQVNENIVEPIELM